MGMIPRFARTIAMMRAMIAPDILDAHSYFCSSQMDEATPRQRITISDHISLGATRLGLPKTFMNTPLNISIDLLSQNKKADIDISIKTSLSA